MCARVGPKCTIQRPRCPRHGAGFAKRSISFHKADESSEPKPINPRWLSHLKQRIGKCITFGLTSGQLEEAGSILQQLSADWAWLVVGREGYLTGPGRVGLDKQAVAWGDMDKMVCHKITPSIELPAELTSVRYLRYAESARCNWMRNIGTHYDPANKRLWTEIVSAKGNGLILRSVQIDYKFPMTWPDRISVFHKLRSRPEKPTDSIVLDVTILSETQQRAAARCLEDIVIYDYRASMKTTLPPFVLDQFQRIYDLQEAARVENGKKIVDLIERVRGIERESWDRPDAQEDLGGSSMP